ncbi:MAG: protein-glutamate O-methyltransferase CheR [Magnetococcales bacterium]|nr:protein-glutamate O-methyltransferase CheR [Magnetococcales bacterium]
MDNDVVQDIEIEILLDVLLKRYGYDFRNYADASLKRRIQRCLTVCKFQYVSEIIPKLLYEGFFLEQLIHELSVSVTEMFRNPSVYRALRKHVIPDLKTYPFINIWHAGCSTGEEVYSMAILLKEEGLYDNARLYATDLDERAVQSAKQGMYSLDLIEEYSNNYQKAGGRNSLADYYQIKDGMAVMDGSLKKNMVFSTHNLATDSVFADMNLIFCRNVLIYFSPELKNRALNLFKNSLVRGGVLCVGKQESLEFTKVEESFSRVTNREKLYYKKVVPGAK